MAGAGGIVGFQKNNGASTSFCYNKEAISAASNIGGIVGDLNSGTISNCYNIGEVTTGVGWQISNIGGICGGNSINNPSSTRINNCYTLDSLNLEVSGDSEKVTIDALSKKETSQNMQADSFITTLNAGTTNFKKSTGYPILNWQ